MNVNIVDIGLERENSGFSSAISVVPHTRDSTRVSFRVSPQGITMNSIYQPCSLTGSTPSGSTNQTEFLDPMLARLSSPSGLERTSWISRLGRHSLKISAQEIVVLIRTPTASAFNLSPVRARILEVTKTARRPPVTITLKMQIQREKEQNLKRQTQRKSERNPTSDLPHYQEALHAQVKRLPAYLKAEVDELYYEFQRQLYLLAIKNRIYAALFYTHLGQINRMRGPTNYNNFCRFDPQAREIFNQKGIPVKQRCKEVAEKWQALTPKIKMKYKDYDLSNPARRCTGRACEWHNPNY
ncbi:hypothetical protein KEM48_002699 [Puccinia striiformis f. sp. tritici PST-130]|nr:hypothetical protein KEM48_002699 [Puccinia striiformis f. sp. tritici PST-130]